MAADSDGDQRNSTDGGSTLKAVVICEGNLHDPDFQARLDCLVARLTTLCDEPADNGKLTVDKVEPWNSVRVTLSIPKEAAVKLRKLAAEGNHALRALGILSVQLEGDTVLSLRLVGQEIVLRTDNSAATPGGGTSSGLGELTRILSQQQQQQQPQPVPHEAVAGPSKAPPPSLPNKPLVVPQPVATPVPVVALSNGPVVVAPPESSAVVFKSPNTICPMDGKLPVHVPNALDSAGGAGDAAYPFESMTQARVIQRRENTLGVGPPKPFVAPNPPIAQQQQPPRFNLGLRPSNTPQTVRAQAMAMRMAQLQQQQLNRFPVQQGGVPFRQPSAPHLQQQMNSARWGSNPQSMDSMTKSSYQEFTRYQMQYNLSQQQLHKQAPQPQQPGATADLLGLNSLGELPDFGKNDLDSLLPTLGSADLDGAFLDGLDLDLEPKVPPAERKWKQQFLINPLTGELEETQTEDIPEEEDDASKNFPEFFSEMSNSLYSDDDDTSCSTGFSKFTSDVSDTERTTSTSSSSLLDGASSSGGFGNAINVSTVSTTPAKLGKPVKAKREKQQSLTPKTKEKKPREKKSSSALKQVKTKAKIVATEGGGGDSPGSQEKIKLRLKLEKPETVGSITVTAAGGISSSLAKKVQSSQVLVTTPGTLGVPNPPATVIGVASAPNLSGGMLSSSVTSPMAAQLSQPTLVGSASFSGTNNSAGLQQMASPSSGEELRVPPLHISLRGKNSVVIKNSKKDRKKSTSGGEEDSDGSGFQLGRKSGGAIKRTSQDGRLTTIMPPSSPNHHNHTLLGAASTVGSPKVKSNKLEDLNKDGSESHKRSAPDTPLQSPNGLLLCPAEKKRRLSGGAVDGVGGGADSNPPASSINEINELYETLISSTAGGPIGSTNVGTLPHSSLLAAATSSAKNLKSSSTNNNSINNSNAFGKQCISGSIKNLVKPAQSSPTTSSSSSSSVSSPGALAAAPNTANSSTSKMATTTTTTTTTATATHTSSDADGVKPEPESSTNKSPNSSNSTSSTSAGSSEQQVSEANQRINNTHHHHHNRPPEQQAAGGGGSSSPATSLDHQQQQQQQQVVPGAIVVAQGVRGSPGSQAQGEDSGIESMDALSEKSPHQVSHSPQGGTDSGNKLILQMDSPKDKQQQQQQQPALAGDAKCDSGTNNNNNSSHTNLDDYIDIEAALAKMEGLNELQVTAASLGERKLNGDHAILLQAAKPKLDEANLSILLGGDDELAEKPQQQESKEVVKGEEAEDWLVKTGSKQQQQQQQHKGEANDILTSSSNNNLTDKTEIKLECKQKQQLALDDCCSNKEVLCLKSECDSNIVDCKAVIKTDPEEANVSSVKQEKAGGGGGGKSHSNSDGSNSSINSLDATKAGEKGDAGAGLLEPKPRHEQPPLYSYSSEKARERRSAANSTTSSNASTPPPSSSSVIEIIDLDDSGKSLDLEPHPQQQQQQPTQATNKPIHSPLTIDIPSQPESAENRVRTRASSKLESPLEPPRQSPSIDSPAAERLKNSLNKHPIGASVANATSTPTTAPAADRLSPKTLPKGKRKRQGSESSNQSCVSDDVMIIPSRTKKPRKAAVAAAAVTNAEKQRKTVPSRATAQRKVAAGSTPATTTTTTTTTTPTESTPASTATVTVEDSSDSDEPLIEIAGSSAEKEKPLRNHKVPVPSTASSAATNHAPSTPTSHKAKAASAAATPSNAVAPSQPGSDEKISTRRSVRMTTSTLSTAAMNSKAKANAANHSDGDDHHPPHNHHHHHHHHKNNHVNHQHSAAATAGATTAASTADGKGSGGGATGAGTTTAAATTDTPTTEARRKTRSAGLDSTAEGRRRRVSRDSK
ncbi:hypothetical protein quinque_010370 [Culex quinquefasciatus]